jgi:tRNA(Ile)-lysidine synthase
MALSGAKGKGDFDGLRVVWQRISQKGDSFKRRSGREIFDSDRVGDRITLRHWRPGDRFQPIGMTQPIKLQDLFTNARIPRETRHNLVVVESVAGELVWVEGLRISERFKLTRMTIRRLQWNWERL